MISSPSDGCGERHRALRVPSMCATIVACALQGTRLRLHLKRVSSPMTQKATDVGEPPAAESPGKTAAEIPPRGPPRHRHYRANQKHVRTTPPSTRSAAPFVADTRGLHTYATRLATSS